MINPITQTSTGPQQNSDHVFLALALVFVICFYFGWDRFVGNRRQPEGMASLTRLVIQCLRMVGNSLVPNKYRPWLVTDTAREILSTDYMIKQELEELQVNFNIRLRD